MRLTITVTTPGYAQVKTIEVESDQLDRTQRGLSPWVRVETQLKAALRDRTTKLSPGWVADALHGAETDRPATTMIIVHSGYLVMKRGGQETLLSVSTRPMPNQIKDFRTKPAPFLRDGSCRG